MLNKDRKILFTILAFLILIRLINITMPILEGTAMRQVQTAMIARNFYREGFNILYPKVDYFGSEPGYLVLEFPLLNILAGFGYILTSGVHEWTGRLLSILFFAGACLFLYGITRRLFNEKTALWAMLVFGLSPLSLIFSRAFMPDFEMLFFCIGALYLFLIYFLEDRQIYYWLSAIFMSIALLVKPHSFYIFIPLLYLVIEKERGRALFDIRNYLYILISFLPAIFWYMHGRNMHLNFTQEQAFNYRMINWFDIKKLSDIRLYVNLLQIYSGIFLTPIGLSLFIGGFFIKTKHRERLIWPWLFGSVLFLIVFATHIEDPYYNLNFLPVASVFIARMIIFLQQSDRKKTFLDSRWGRIILIALILPFWLRYAAYAYIVPKGYRYIPEAGIEIQNITQKEDLVIASSAGGPQGLYFCDRKGWGFTLPQNQQEEAPAVRDLEQYIDKGAKYFVSMKIDDFENTVYFKQYLFQNYKTVAYQKDKFIIFGLEKQRKER